MGPRLTEEKLKNARFREKEKAIFRVFFEEEGGEAFNVEELVVKIGISRGTFYRHHRAACEIEEDYKCYILMKYEKLMEKVKERDGVGLRRMYYEMVIFILQNRKIFEALIKRKNFGVIEEMFEFLKPEIMVSMRLPSNSERVIRVYIGEMTGLMVDWALRGLKGTEIVELLNNMMYLTEKTREQLLLLG